MDKKHKQLLTFVQYYQRLDMVGAGEKDASLDAIEAPAARDERCEVALQRVEAAGHVDEFPPLRRGPQEGLEHVRTEAFSGRVHNNDVSCGQIAAACHNLRSALTL